MKEKIEDVNFARQLLKLMPDAFVLVDTDQRIVHVNPQAEALFQETAVNMLGQPLNVILPREIAGQHFQYIQNFLESSEQVKMLDERGVLLGRRKNGERFSFLGTIAKLHLPEGIWLAIIMREVTEYLQSEQRNKKLERASYCLSQSLSAVIQAQDETELLQDICRITVETGGYLFAWIGFAREDAEKSVQPVAFAGQNDGYLQNVFVSWDKNDPSGCGPVGRAIRLGKPQLSRNTAKDRNFAFWREQALKRGFCSVAAFPLKIDNRQAQAALTLCSSEDTFDREEVDLISTLAENLSFGLTALRTREERDKKETILHQNTALLQERMKELNLLYTISRLKSRDDLSIEDILAHITEAIPQAMQFPDIAQACIQIQGYGEFQTPEYAQSSLNLSQPIVFGGQAMGSVEVVYTQAPSKSSLEVFLPEEQKTLESVAFHIVNLISHVQMANEQRKLSCALEQTADTVVITDMNGVIEYVNPSFEINTGYSREEAVGNKPNILKSGEHPPEFYQTMWQVILQGKVYRDTVINRAKDGSVYYEYKTITPLYDQTGTVSHFLATGKDLTAQLRTESRLQYLASHDPVTDLMNHNEFIRRVDQLITESSQKSAQRVFAVIAIGIDNFKAVNELLGRHIGDKVLKQIGKRLSHKSVFTLSRLEGDTFGLVVQGSTARHTGGIVQSFLDQIAQPLSLEGFGQDLVLTATAGISCYPGDAGSGVKLVQMAQTAMFRAKRSGIQRFDFFTPDMQDVSLKRLRLNKELLDALHENQFILYFQPQINITAGEISGAEALVRWNHPIRGMLGPQEFIPALEEMGRIGEMGDFVLHQACSTMAHIKDMGLQLPKIAINLAAPQLEDPSLGSKIADNLQAAGLSPDQLELEVTESLLISSYEQVQNLLSELLNMGIGIALDDFGTGYSSLQYLTRYPFSKLKIDKSFVWNMTKGDKDYEVVKAIISLGHSLQIKVLAEGVENDEHVRTLRGLGCELFQGYLYSPPVDEKAFITYLKSY